MKKNAFVAVFVFNMLLTSCFTAKGLINRSDKEVAPFDKSVINGTYENILPDNPDYSLWQDLSANERFRAIPPSVENSLVKLELVNNKTLMAHLLIAGEPVESLKIKGRLKHDYFIANRKFFMLPLLFVNFYQDHKTIIGNLPNGDFHLVQGKQVHSLIFTGDSDADVEYINADYQRIDTTVVRILKKNL